MRFLAPLTLTTRTLARAARGGAGLVVHVTKGIAGHVRPGDTPTPQHEAATPPQRPTTTAPPRAAARPAAAAVPTPARPAPAPASVAPAPLEPAEPTAPDQPDQPEFAPPHIDEEESEVVYSSSDAGAENGAGPSIHIDEPWNGYRGMSAADVIDRLAVADTAMLAAVQLYETSHKQRPSVLKAVDLRLEAAARA